MSTLFYSNLIEEPSMEQVFVIRSVSKLIYQLSGQQRFVATIQGGTFLLRYTGERLTKNTRSLSFTLK
jgi:hypothetical protein